MGESNGDESRNKASDPLVGLKFYKIVDPVRIVHILQSFVLEGVVGADKLL